MGIVNYDCWMSHAILKKLAKSEFVEASRGVETVAAFLRLFDIAPDSGAYKLFKTLAAKHKVDLKHFVGQAHLKGKKHLHRNSISLDAILAGLYPLYPPVKLKKRLVQELGWELRCKECGITEWNGKPAPIQLDHINGISNDHRLENLRFLCCNCHAQTQTYAGRNRNKSERPTIVCVAQDFETPCLVCQKMTITEYCSIRCTNVGHRKCKLDAKGILDILVGNDFNMSKTSREIGISTTAIKKRLLKAGLGSRSSTG